MATYAPYEFLFTDQNPNREFVVQPYTMNGPSSPDGGVDPSAATANTTLFLYGQGSPNYGDRIQENLIYMMEHFFNSTEPSFPIPGQLWCQGYTNELTTPFQMYMYNPRKFTITTTSTNQIYVVSDDGSLTVAQVQARFNALGLSKQFTVYDSNYNETNFIQSALPVISGSSVMLTVTPAVPAGGLTGQYTGGWEELYQGNATIVLRRPFNAGGYNIINLANPINPQDAATKAYVDSTTTGGTIYLANLADVSITSPTTGQVLTYNGTVWINSSSYLPISGGTMTGTINMNGYGITNVPTPINPYDVANKLYVDSEPLSSAYVTITTPTNLNILYFSSGTSQWINGSAMTAGLVPLTGGVTMSGGIDMGGNALTGLATPVNPTDATNKAYVDSLAEEGAGTVTSGTFNNTTGILTLNLSGAFPPVNINGFLPTPNNLAPAYGINYIPQNPSSLPSPPANQFFASVLGDATYAVASGKRLQDPISVLLDSALTQIDVALGNFVVPRQRLVFPVSGTRTNFNLLAQTNIATTGDLTQPLGGTITSGTYTNVPLTGGSGFGAAGTVVVTGGSGPIINLNSAVTYAVLGSSTVTNTGSSVITGDLGLYPGTSVTGFPPGTISGTENINNNAAQTATTDAQNAYTSGQALPGATVLSASTYELGGTTLTPGLYSIGTSATITGTVTLNAAGNPDAYFIFQIGSTLLPANSSVVLLTNGAQAQNVYWLVGSSATIGTSATFYGTIIANVSITADTNASVTGHLFAPFTGAVTLDANAVTATPAGSGSGGTVASVTITSSGVNYSVNDILTYTGVGIGTGGTITVLTVNSISNTTLAQYVKGSNNLAIYLNGVKQVASTSAFANVTNFTINGTYAITSASSAGIVVAGNYMRVFHPGVQFTVSGTSSTNDGNYIVTNSTFASGNTTITVIPNAYNLNAAQVYPLVSSLGGTITYTVTDLREDMETGYTAGSISLNVSVNSAPSVTLTLNTSNITSLGQLRDAINTLAASYYVNAIVGISGSSFIVAGNRTTQFTTGTSFTVQYSTGNNTTYTVASGATYSSLSGQTTIPVGVSLNDTANGIIFQNSWAFSMRIENGVVVFYSNIAGSTSSISVTDPGGVSGVFSAINGVTWPIKFTNGFTATTSNIIAPADYAYVEVGVDGWQTSLFVFNVAPSTPDVMEILIDREMVYNSTNPLALATIA